MDAANNVMGVDLASKKNQLGDKELMVGFTTKQIVAHLQDNVELEKIKKFSTDIHAFFNTCLTYFMENFSWDDDLLNNACFVDFEKRKQCSFTAVEYFPS